MFTRSITITLESAHADDLKILIIIFIYIFVIISGGPSHRWSIMQVLGFTMDDCGIYVVISFIACLRELLTEEMYRVWIEN